jgi:hypothetical protein
VLKSVSHLKVPLHSSNVSWFSVIVLSELNLKASCCIWFYKWIRFRHRCIYNRLKKGCVNVQSHSSQ